MTRPSDEPQPDSGLGEERYMTVGGLKIRTSVMGSGNPLLLMNGIGSSIEMWTPLRSRLTGIQTIAFDAPGTGESSTPRSPRRMRALSRMVAHTLDRLGYAEVDVFGFSFGGMLAQQFVRDHPTRVRRLILAATTPGVGGVAGDPRAMRVLATARRYLDQNYLTRVASIVYGGRSARDPDFLQSQRVARSARPPTSYGYASQLAATIGWSSLGWLHRIHQPTLVLAGAEDPVTPPVNGRIIAATIPHASLRILPDAGHLFPLDSAEEVAPLILDWIS